jgi:hypothetical protein
VSEKYIKFPFPVAFSSATNEGEFSLDPPSTSGDGVDITEKLVFILS